ncbi:hypothetical protein AgCh_037092 [Apium graveolens]
MVSPVSLMVAMLVVTAAAAMTHDYKDALMKSIMFFEGQRSGKLPPNQRITWRGDSALKDGFDNLVKFGDTMYTELPHALEAIKWATDCLLLATNNPNVVYVLVGDPWADHNCWERPEDMDTPRTFVFVTKDYPGSEVSAEIAAALAVIGQNWVPAHVRKEKTREETELSLALEGGAEPPVVRCHLQLRYAAPKAKEILSLLQPGDKRITIEKAAHKYAETSTNPWESMTPEQIQAAMDLWKEKNKAPETRPGDQEEHSEESRGSVLDRIGITQKWFSRISSRSIDSWKDFREIFLKRFRANRMNELQICHLETIQQRSRETLPEFIKRFQESVNQLSNLEEKEAVNIFRRNLHPVSCEGCVKDLIHREPQSLASAYAMTSKFIKENDFLTSMKMNRRIRDDDESPERRSTYGKEKRHRKDRQTNYVQQSRGTPPRDDYSRPQKIERKPKPKRDPKPEPEWTPLNRPRPTS